MWWPVQWLVIYVLGGLTFVPLLVVSAIWYGLTYGSVPIGDPDPTKKEKAALQEQAEKEELLATASANGRKPLSGWLTVRRHFKPFGAANSLFSTDLAGAEGEGAALEKEDASIRSEAPTTNPNGHPTTYSSRIAQTYRQMVEARSGRREAQPKEYLFCVLKGTVMFLYDDEAQTECIAAIGINKYLVNVENGSGIPFDGKDAELFAKRNAIVLRIANGEDQGEGKKGLPVLAKGMEGDHHKDEAREMESAPWFLFSKSNTKLEDWYLALVQASNANPNTSDVFSTSDMRALVDMIDTEPDPIPMRWMNAMVGRIFFGLYKTEALEQFIIGKIMKKLTKVPRPSFLGPIVVREVNVGTFPPIFSKPMLKNLTAEGTASFEVHLNYRSRPHQTDSQVRITIATTATIPTGFKPYVVDLVLAVVLKSMEGNMVMQIKRPPSNRFWYGFTQMPKMEVEIRPIVSERRIQIGMILKAIEKQLREVIAESVVLPNMDDIAFFDTRDMLIRGGIFSQAGKGSSELGKDPPVVVEETPAPTAIDVGSAAADPSSATAETPALRKRRPTKSQTLGTTDTAASSTSSEGHPPDLGILRTETASAEVGNDAGVKKASAVLPTRKWFATAGNGRTPSIGSTSGLSAGSQESLNKPRSGSAERPEVGPKDKSDSSGTASDSVKPSSMADPPIGSKAPETTNPPQKGRIPFHSLGRLSTDSHSSTSTATAADQTGRDAQAPGTSTSSLLTSLRARDKQAVQAQVTSAKDAVRKWSVNWAAKRRAGSSTVYERDEVRPTTMYHGPDNETEGGSSKAGESPKTLKERLDAAAHSDQSPNRQRSTSSASRDHARPSLSSSPGPSFPHIVPGSPPPQWTLTTSGPTTEVAKADASAIPGPSHHRTMSASNPVFRQPSAGRGMVVPRVPKRPGEVVGMGSSGRGITRRISGNDVDVKDEDERGDKAEKGNLMQVAVRQMDVKQDHKAKDEADERAPPLPPLPRRIPSPHISPGSSAVSLTDKEHVSESVEPPDAGPTLSPLGGSEMRRADSAPPATAVPASLTRRVSSTSGHGEDNAIAKDLAATIASADTHEGHRSAIAEAASFPDFPPGVPAADHPHEPGRSHDSPHSRP